MTGTMITAQQFKPAELVSYIDKIHHEILGHTKAALFKAKEAGNALLKLKEVCKHGEFEKAVEMECSSLSIRTARTYMSIAAGWDLIMERVGPGQASQLTITEGIRLLAKPKKEKAAAPADFPLSGEDTKVYEVLNDEPKPPPNPKPDAIKVAPHAARKKGVASHEAQQLFVRSQNMYEVLFGLLEDLNKACPIPDNIISCIDGLKQSHLDFETWREAVEG